jgi:hypothetical protein
LSPLPLFSIIPLTGEPGIMIDCVAPEVPVTRPGPREVITLEDNAGADNGGARVGAGNGANVGAGVVCPKAGPASTTNDTHVRAVHIAKGILIAR